MKLLTEALVKFACGIILVGLMLFWPAGTIHYTGGWRLLILLFVPMLAAGFVMYFKNPDFLKKRLDAKEKQKAQKGVLAFSGLMFIAAFVIAGLDFRFGWLELPGWVTITASVLFLMMPLVLGSLYALIPMAFYPVIIIVRLKDEEALLTRELNGYEDYKKKVKYRLIPFIW